MPAILIDVTASYAPNPDELRYAHTPKNIQCYTTHPTDIGPKNDPSCVTQFIELYTQLVTAIVSNVGYITAHCNRPLCFCNA